MRRHTLVDGDDVRVIERRHDLDLSPDADQILFIFNIFFLDGFDGHLQHAQTHSIARYWEFLELQLKLINSVSKSCY